MPKTLTAKSVVHINPLHFIMDGPTVIGLRCAVEVNYGELGIAHEVDLWADMTALQKQKVQAIRDYMGIQISKFFLE